MPEWVRIESRATVACWSKDLRSFPFPRRHLRLSKIGAVKTWFQKVFLVLELAEFERGLGLPLWC